MDLTPQVGSENPKMDSVGNRVDRLDGVLVTAKLAGMSASQRVAKRGKRGRVEESNVWRRPLGLEPPFHGPNFGPTKWSGRPHVKTAAQKPLVASATPPRRLTRN